MIELLTLLTGVVIVGFSLFGLVRSRDPLFPMTILGPMLLYVYVYSPMIRISSGSLLEYFPNFQELVFVQVVQLVSVAAFCLGCTWYRRPPGIDQRFSMLRQQIPLHTRRRMLTMVVVLATVACGSFMYMVWYSGGWVRVFSEVKPFIRAPSGYIGELPMLSYPAIFILSFALQGRRLTGRRVLAMLIVMFPHIVMATLGGRRGPMFLSACSLFGAWCIISQRRPQVKTVLGGLATLGCLMLLLQANRANLFRPWQEEIETSFAEQLWSPPMLSAGDEYVVAAATVLTTSKYEHYYWGARYFATFFVRPIPRFLWPTKYEDMGLGWMATDPGKSGIPTSQWLDAVGFEPAGGSAGGFIADLFLEFSWGCVIVCFLLGLLFSSVWRKWTTCGELWTLIYFEFMILSVYLVAQSLGAWLYRIVFVVTLTWAFWKWNSLGSRPSKRFPGRHYATRWPQPAVPVHHRLRR